MKVVGIDVGASKIAVGLVDSGGKLLGEQRQPTPADPNQAVELIVKLAKSYLEQSATAVGVGAPGPIDFDHGNLLKVTNLPGWRNFPLRERLSQALKVPVVLENDANVALLGEIWQGAGKGKDPVIMLTLGTGVGGALWKEGEIWHGETGHGAELGHTVIDPNFDGSCQAGHRGDIEAMVGGVSVKKRYGKDIKTLFSDSTFLREWTANLRRGLIKLIAEHQPLIIILGGGVSNDAAMFLPQLQDLGVPVVKAKLGTNAGIIGAAYLALKSNGL